MCNSLTPAFQQFSDDEIGDAGARCISDMLKLNESLTLLNLRSKCFTVWLWQGFKYDCLCCDAQNSVFPFSIFLFCFFCVFFFFVCLLLMMLFIVRDVLDVFMMLWMCRILFL